MHDEIETLLDSFLTNLENETKKIARIGLIDFTKTTTEGFFSDKIRTIFATYKKQLDEFQIKVNRDRNIVLLPHLFELVISTLTREFFMNYPNRNFSVRMEMHLKVTNKQRVNIPDITILENSKKIAIIELKWQLKLNDFKSEIERREKFSDFLYFTLLYWNQTRTVIDKMIANKCKWVYSINPYTKISAMKKGMDANQLKYIESYLDVNNSIEQIFNNILSHKM